MTDEDIRRDLLIAFEYSYHHEDWVNPLADALEGLSAKEALRDCGQETKCIWEIVLHLTVWNENIVERIRSGTPAKPGEGPWPALPEVTGEPAWESAKSRLWHSLNSIRTTLETAPFERLSGPPYGLPDLMCRFTHTAYHLGQITKLRECQNRRES